MKEFEIQFSGLNVGLHEFEFEIGDKFFAFFKNQDEDISTVETGNLKAKVTLDKKETMLVFDFEISGELTVPCDVCMGNLNVPLNTERRIIGKFSDEETWHEDEIVHLPTTSYKIDLTELLNEFIMLALPSKNAHEEADCDPEMIEALSNYKVTEQEEESSIDPRWEKLKNLK